MDSSAIGLLSADDMTRHSCPKPDRTLSGVAILAVLLALISASAARAGEVVDKVKARGEIRCGAVARPGLLEFAFTGRAAGLFVDLCRALGTAALGPQAKVVITAYEAERSYDAVRNGHDDVYFLSASEIVDEKLAGGILLGPAVFYERTAVIVAEASAVQKLEELASRPICFPQGTNAHRHLEAWFERHRLSFQRMAYQEEGEMRDAYNAGACLGLAGEETSLAAAALDLGVRGVHSRILAEPLAAFPILAASSTKDAEWAAIIAWTVATLMRADAPSSNWAPGGIDSLPLDLPELGLDKGWQRRVIEATGGYEAMFRRNLGTDAPYRLPRGLNAPWWQGGLMLAPYVE
jgi:general L-amino acid transport system substrate-binding protein